MTRDLENLDDTPSFRVVLKGETAEFGQVLAADVARLIDGALTAIARAAEAVSGRQARVGTRGSLVENASRFTLGGVFDGSVCVALRPPALQADPDAMDLEDSRLSDQSVNRILDALVDTDVDARIAGALADMGDTLGLGSRYRSIQFEVVRTTGEVQRTESLNPGVSEKLRRIATKDQDSAHNAVSGTLVEADFERFSARLKTPSNHSVRVSFHEEHADHIQRALRQKTEPEGVITYDRVSREAIRVELNTVNRTEQQRLDLIGLDYWADLSVAEAAADQGVAMSGDPILLGDSDIGTDETEAFLEALGL